MPNIVIVNSDGINQGESFNAQVDTPQTPVNHGGHFAFLQLVKIDRTVTTNTGVVSTRLSKNYVLDALPNANDLPLFGDYVSNDYQPALTNIPIPETPYAPGTIGDSPEQGATISDYATGLYAQKITVNDNFKMYLLYLSDDLEGSAYVAIGMISWQFSGTITYNGPAQGAPNSYADPEQWSIVGAVPNLPPGQEGTLNFVAPDTPFPTWVQNTSDIKFR